MKTIFKRGTKKDTFKLCKDYRETPKATKFIVGKMQGQQSYILWLELIK